MKIVVKWQQFRELINIIRNCQKDPKLQFLSKKLISLIINRLATTEVLGFSRFKKKSRYLL